MLERGVDLVSDRGDRFGQVHEWWESAATSPGQPAIQGDLRPTEPRATRQRIHRPLADRVDILVNNVGGLFRLGAPGRLRLIAGAVGWLATRMLP